jgi:hypothetical protein
MQRQEKLNHAVTKPRRVIDFNAEPAPVDPWEEFDWVLGAEASLSDSVKADLKEARALFSPDWYS